MKKQKKLALASGGLVLLLGGTAAVAATTSVTTHDVPIRSVLGSNDVRIVSAYGLSVRMSCAEAALNHGGEGAIAWVTGSGWRGTGVSVLGDKNTSTPAPESTWALHMPQAVQPPPWLPTHTMLLQPAADAGTYVSATAELVSPQGASYTLDLGYEYRFGAGACRFSGSLTAEGHR